MLFYNEFITIKFIVNLLYTFILYLFCRDNYVGKKIRIKETRKS